MRLERLAVAPACLAVAAFAAALCSCALSAGAIVTSPQASTPLVVSGPSLDGTLQLPSTYRAIVGWEWTRQNTAADLWRLGVLAGYVSPPERTRWLGWEATGRAGLLRSWNGPATEMGWFAGAAVSALLRLESGAQPWTGDSLLQVMPILVLDLGVNELWPAGRSAETEVAARALLRVHFSSTLIP